MTYPVPDPDYGVDAAIRTYDPIAQGILSHDASLTMTTSDEDGITFQFRKDTPLVKAYTLFDPHDGAALLSVHGEDSIRTLEDDRRRCPYSLDINGGRHPVRISDGTFDRLGRRNAALTSVGRAIGRIEGEAQAYEIGRAFVGALLSSVGPPLDIAAWYAVFSAHGRLRPISLRAIAEMKRRDDEARFRRNYVSLLPTWRHLAFGVGEHVAAPLYEAINGSPWRSIPER